MKSFKQYKKNPTLLTKNVQNFPYFYLKQTISESVINYFKFVLSKNLIKNSEDLSNLPSSYLFERNFLILKKINKITELGFFLNTPNFLSKTLTNYIKIQSFKKNLWKFLIKSIIYKLIYKRKTKILKIKLKKIFKILLILTKTSKFKNFKLQTLKYKKIFYIYKYFLKYKCQSNRNNLNELKTNLIRYNYLFKNLDVNNWMPGRLTNFKFFKKLLKKRNQKLYFPSFIFLFNATNLNPMVKTELKQIPILNFFKFSEYNYQTEYFNKGLGKFFLKMFYRLNYIKKIKNFNFLKLKSLVEIIIKINEFKQNYYEDYNKTLILKKIEYTKTIIPFNQLKLQNYYSLLDFQIQKNQDLFVDSESKNYPLYDFEPAVTNFNQLAKYINFYPFRTSKLLLKFINKIFFLINYKRRVLFNFKLSKKNYLRFRHLIVYKRRRFFNIPKNTPGKIIYYLTHKKKKKINFNQINNIIKILKLKFPTNKIFNNLPTIEEHNIKILYPYWELLLLLLLNRVHKFKLKQKHKWISLKKIYRFNFYFNRCLMQLKKLNKNQYSIKTKKQFNKKKIYNKQVIYGKSSSSKKSSI